MKRLLILFLTASFIFAGCGSDTVSVKENAIEPTPFVVDSVESCDKGTITVYENDGEVRNTYQGPIDILNDGKNGEEIEIVINLP